MLHYKVHSVENNLKIGFLKILMWNGTAGTYNDCFIGKNIESISHSILYPSIIPLQVIRESSALV